MIRYFRREGNITVEKNLIKTISLKNTLAMTLFKLHSWLWQRWADTNAKIGQLLQRLLPFPKKTSVPFDDNDGGSAPGITIVLVKDTELAKKIIRAQSWTDTAVALILPSRESLQWLNENVRHDRRWTDRDNFSVVEEVSEPVRPRRKDQLFLDRLEKVLNAQISDDTFNVENLARAMTISHSQLFRKVKAITGKSIVLFIRRYRCQRARALLHETDKSISEIAYDVGFKDPSYFSKCYIKEFGIAPSLNRRAMSS